jgi:hypothetical protein
MSLTTRRLSETVLGWADSLKEEIQEDPREWQKRNVNGEYMPDELVDNEIEQLMLEEDEL